MSFKRGSLLPFMLLNSLVIFHFYTIQQSYQPFCLWYGYWSFAASGREYKSLLLSSELPASKWCSRVCIYMFTGWVCKGVCSRFAFEVLLDIYTSVSLSTCIIFWQGCCYHAFHFVLPCGYMDLVGGPCCLLDHRGCVSFVFCTFVVVTQHIAVV